MIEGNLNMESFGELSRLDQEEELGERVEGEDDDDEDDDDCLCLCAFAPLIDVDLCDL